MRDKDSKLIWEAHSNPEQPLELPHKEIGVLKEDMVIIIMDMPGQKTGQIIMKQGSGQNLIFTPDDAKMFMHRMNADRGPNEEEHKLHAGIMAEKGTRVEVTYWGPGNNRFRVRMLEPITISEHPGFNVQDEQLKLTDRETAEELIDRWIDFSKSALTISRLKGLR